METFHERKFQEEIEEEPAPSKEGRSVLDIISSNKNKSLTLKPGELQCFKNKPIYLEAHLKYMTWFGFGFCRISENCPVDFASDFAMFFWQMMLAGIMLVCGLGRFFFLFLEENQNLYHYLTTLYFIFLVYLFVYFIVLSLWDCGSRINNLLENINQIYENASVQPSKNQVCSPVVIVMASSVFVAMTTVALSNYEHDGWNSLPKSFVLFGVKRDSSYWNVTVFETLHGSGEQKHVEIQVFFARLGILIQFFGVLYYSLIKDVLIFALITVRSILNEFNAYLETLEDVNECVDEDIRKRYAALLNILNEMKACFGDLFFLMKVESLAFVGIFFVDCFVLEESYGRGILCGRLFNLLKISFVYYLEFITDGCYNL